MPPKPKTPVPAALHPQVQMSSGCASEVHKRQDSTSLKQGQKKRRKTKASSANTTATSPVSLASDVGHVGTQRASESREKARAHSKKLFDSMIARTKHVDNPPPWDVGTEADFCTKRTSEGSQDICRRLYVTENKSEGGHRTGEGNLLLCSTALTYLQDFFQVVKSKYETIGTENLKQSFSSCLQLRCCHHFIGTSYCLKSCMLATLANSCSNLPTLHMLTTKQILFTFLNSSK